ncbi:MAG: MBL fold metallo-hydrolase [Phycisphaerales bacterium]|nr:MBL fold metallo-hydrolase [Phycisphaerales bacterium]
MITRPAFILLGTGTSAGIPVIGCDCRVCTSGDPRDARLRTAAAIRYVDAAGHPRTILIDASPDLRQQALRHRIDRCDAVIFTHNHVDHTFGLDETRRFNALMRSPIDIYADPHTLEHLHRVYRHIFRKEQNVNDSFVATLIPHVLDVGMAQTIHNLRFEPVRLLHGRLPVLGFRIDVVDGAGDVVPDPPAPFPLAYCTDVSAIPPETWPRLAGLRTLVLDMLRYRSHPTHLTVDEAIGTAEQIAATNTWFIHMTHEILHAELDAALPPGMRLGHDGLVLSDES